MYDVYFQYFDGNDFLCREIAKISYPTTSGLTSIAGEEIMTNHYNLNKDLYLYSDTSTYSVSCKGLKSIEIRKN